MDKYSLSCGSTADLTKEQMKERKIRYVCFPFFLDNQEYPDDMGETVSPEELYEKMINGAKTKTAQVPFSEYMAYFEQMLQEGEDILHIEFSSGLSGSYNTACLAAAELLEKYPNRKLYVVDSLAASSGYGLIMETLADMRDEGKSMEELRDWIEHNKLRMHHLFFSTDLTFYVRGGRISKTVGKVGTMLNICPFLYMDEDGTLKLCQKMHGKKKAIEHMLKMMETYADNGTLYDGKCYICHSACLEDAKTIAGLVEQKFPHLHGKAAIYPIGAAIGSHAGPGTLALFFWGDRRK